MDKKGVELTMNTIIITVLLLIVMIVLMMIFTGRIKLGVKDIDDAGKGLECPKDYIGCKDDSGHKAFECTKEEKEMVGNYAAYKEGQRCCCKIS